MAIYTDVNGAVKQITGLYAGVNGVSKYSRGAYAGVNGVVKQVYPTIEDYLSCVIKFMYYQLFYTDTNGNVVRWITNNGQTNITDVNFLKNYNCSLKYSTSDGWFICQVPQGMGLVVFCRYLLQFNGNSVKPLIDFKNEIHKMKIDFFASDITRMGYTYVEICGYGYELRASDNYFLQGVFEYPYNHPNFNNDYFQCKVINKANSRRDMTVWFGVDRAKRKLIINDRKTIILRCQL